MSETAEAGLEALDLQALASDIINTHIQVLRMPKKNEDRLDPYWIHSLCLLASPSCGAAGRLPSEGCGSNWYQGSRNFSVFRQYSKNIQAGAPMIQPEPCPFYQWLFNQYIYIYTYTHTYILHYITVQYITVQYIPYHTIPYHTIPYIHT